MYLRIVQKQNIAMKELNKIDILRRLVFDGAIFKKLLLEEKVLDRLDYELLVINSLNLSGYFILYSRIIQVCNELKLLLSPGRESSTGSLVNYCLDITKINPLEYGLIFERFINIKSNTLADIDIDIPQGSQLAVVNRLKEKYPQYNADFIAFNPERKTDYQDVVFNGSILKKHPCGIIITEGIKTHKTFSYKGLDYYYFLDNNHDDVFKSKIDILELPYLNKIQQIVDIVGNKYHPYKIPLNDESVFKLISLGDNSNLFQLASPSLKSKLIDFKVNDINDLAMINATFRPNSLSLLYDLVFYRRNFFTNKFYNIDLNNILAETNGILIYQETFLEILNKIAGVSYVEADLWRYRLFKSNDFVRTFNDFIDTYDIAFNCLNNQDKTKLMEMIKNNYRSLFIKSHALSYAIIGYWGAFYKTHFYNEFHDIFKE